MKRNAHLRPSSVQSLSLFPEPKVVIEKQETVVILQLPPHKDLSGTTAPLTEEEWNDLYNKKSDRWWDK